MRKSTFSKQAAHKLRDLKGNDKRIKPTNRAKKIALNGEAKLIVLADNCPADSKQDLEHYCKLASIPLLEFEGTSAELGVVCGKPFPICAITVLEAGDSDILEAVKDAKPAAAE